MWVWWRSQHALHLESIGRPFCVDLLGFHFGGAQLSTSRNNNPPPPLSLSLLISSQQSLHISLGFEPLAFFFSSTEFAISIWHWIDDMAHVWPLAWLFTRHRQLQLEVSFRRRQKETLHLSTWIRWWDDVINSTTIFRVLPVTRCTKSCQSIIVYTSQILKKLSTLERCRISVANRVYISLLTPFFELML